MRNWLLTSLVWKYCIDPIIDGSGVLLGLHKHLKTSEPDRYPKALAKFIIKANILILIITLIAVCF